MENFFSKVSAVDTHSTYHEPYKNLSANRAKQKRAHRAGDFVTTLWLETASLTVFMSSIVLLPSLIWF